MADEERDQPETPPDQPETPPDQPETPPEQEGAEEQVPAEEPAPAAAEAAAPDEPAAEEPAPEGEFDPYAATHETPVAEGEEAATVEEAPTAPAPAARTPLELAADARYRATGKRKRAIARVILKPGAGTYTINGKELDVYFPRVTLQRNARLPLQTTGNDTRMDVVAKIHGGGVSSQAIPVHHGISRA